MMMLTDNGKIQRRDREGKKNVRKGEKALSGKGMMPTRSEKRLFFNTGLIVNK